MKQSAYRELAAAENHFWWHIGRQKIIEKQLSKLNPIGSPIEILNVGAGTGGTVPMLEKFGTVINADSSKEAIKYLEASGYKATFCDGQKLPFPNSSFDMVVALDVLEHIEDEGMAIMDWARVLRPDGMLLITVPAYPWLWSSHDEANMHFRRYTKRSLRGIIKSSGRFTIQKISYMIVFSLPLIIGYRILEKVKKLGSTHRPNTSPKTNFIPVPAPVNKFFISLLSMEATLQQKIDFPFGTSLIAVVHKARN